MGFFDSNHKNLVFVPVFDQSTATASVRKILPDPYYHRTHKAVNNTLTHVMHLFEEKSKYPPVPVDGPLPIKANGAIVVNRPNQQTASIRSLPLYLQDYESDEEDEYLYIQEKETKKEQESVTEAEEDYHTTTESSISDNTSSDTNALNVMHLVHEENHRLRQQILLEREQNDKYRIAKDRYEQELVFAKQRIKNLQHTADRFRKLLSVGHAANANNTSTRLRRQSTGAYFSDILTPSNAMAVSYEHKLQILLNEIEAMEQDEMESTKNMTIQRNERDKLMRKIKFKDDIIRQLAYDLQFEKNLH